MALKSYEPGHDLQTGYCTRGGRNVRILDTNAKGAFPIIGAVALENGGELPESWTRDGRRFVDTETLYDLMVKPIKPIKHVWWVNIYGHRRIDAWSSREIADEAAVADRIACIRVEFEEGEGLE